MSSARLIIRKIAHSLGFDIVRLPANESQIASNPFLSLLSDSRLVKVRVKDCVDKLGICYEPRHPWVGTVRQLLAANGTDIDAPVSELFLQNWRFPLIEEVFGKYVGDDKVGRHFLRVFHGGSTFLPFYDVKTEGLRELIKACTVYLEAESASAGTPISIENALNEDGTWTQPQVRVELHRLWKVLQSIRQRGYQPTPLTDGDILVYALHRNHEYRYVVVSGYHRISVLSALGFENIRVRLYRSLVIDSASVDIWPGVISGVYSRRQALQYFDHLFDFSRQYLDK